MKARDWLPAKLWRLLRQHYTGADYELTDYEGGPPPSDAVWKSLVHRGRFARTKDLEEGRPRIRLKTRNPDGTLKERTEWPAYRVPAITWRIYQLESDVLVDGVLPTAVGFEVELRHGDAAECARAMDTISDALMPYMTSLDSVYDADDDPTAQEFRQHACIAEFALPADGLPGFSDA